MKYLGRIANCILVAFSARGGYSMMASRDASHLDTDWIVGCITFAAMPIFALVSVQYSFSLPNQLTVRRASWKRFSLDWWRDPLQCLWLSTCVMAATDLGGVFRLLGQDPSNWCRLMPSGGSLLGLIIGLLLVHRVYRERIVD
jgi:hypothetical protein